MDSRSLEILLKARDDASKVLDKASKNADHSFGRMGGSIKKLAIAAGGLYALKKGVDFVKDAAKAAMEEATKIASLSTVMDNTGATQAQTDAMLKFVDATTLASGVADDQMYPALAKLQVATKDAAKSQDLLVVAMDVAAGREKDLGTVSEALAKAQQGNVSGLAKLGVATKDASGKTLSFDKIVESLRKTYKGAQQAIADKNPWQVAKNAWGEAKESLGQGLLPAIQQIGKLASSVMPMISKIFEAVGIIIGKVLGKVADVFEQVWPFVQDIMEEFTGWLEGDGAGIFETVFDIIGSGLKILKSIFAAVWPAVKSVVKVFSDWFNSPAFKGMMKAVIDLIINVVQQLLKVWNAVWPAIGPILKTALKIITPVITAIVKIISGIITVVSKVIGWFTGLPGKIKGALSGAARWLVDIGKKILGGLKDGIHKGWDAVWKWLGNIGRWVGEKFKNAGGWLLDAGKAIIRGLWDGLKAIWTSVKNWFLDKVKWLNAILPEKYEIHSPSRVFARYGRGIMQGLHQGLASEIGGLQDTMDRATAVVSGTKMKPGFAMPAVAFGGGAGSFVPSTVTRSGGYAGGGSASGSQRFSAEVPIVLQLDSKVLSRTLGTVVVSGKRTGAS